MQPTTITTKQRRARTPASAPPEMTEAQLQAAILELAHTAGYLIQHNYDSRRTEAGFPDLVLAHADPRVGRVIYAELKSERGRVRPAQMQWLTVLEAAGNEVHVWRPRDWRNGTIEAVLMTPLVVAGAGLRTSA